MQGWPERESGWPAAWRRWGDGSCYAAVRPRRQRQDATRHQAGEAASHGTSTAQSAARDGAAEDCGPAGRGGRRGRHGGAPGRRHNAFFFFLLYFFLFGFQFLLFNWADKGAHVHVSRCTSFKCKLSTYRWACNVRISVSSAKIDNQFTLQQASKNLAVLCDSNVKSWFFGI
jgi:hypothetical protein